MRWVLGSRQGTAYVRRQPLLRLLSSRSPSTRHTPRSGSRSEIRDIRMESYTVYGIPYPYWTVDSGRRRLDVWTSGVWTSGRLESGRLDVWSLDCGVWILEARTRPLSPVPLFALCSRQMQGRAAKKSCNTERESGHHGRMSPCGTRSDGIVICRAGRPSAIGHRASPIGHRQSAI